MIRYALAAAVALLTPGGGAALAPRLRSLHPGWTISDRAAAAEIRYMDQELAGTKKRPIPVAD